MQSRLLKFVHFGEGVLDCSNFTYGPRKRELHDLFCAALPVVQPYVRKLCLHGQHLYQNGSTNISKFLASIPNLAEIEFCGVDRGMPCNLAFPLEGLSKNTSGKLRKITFNCVDVINGVDVETFEALARIQSIKELEVRCCSRWVEQNIKSAFSSHPHLEIIMMDCYLANGGLTEFLSSLPNLRSFRSINAVYVLSSLPDTVGSLTKLSLCLQHTPLDTFTTSLDLVLRRTRSLKELELKSYSANSGHNADFGLVLSELSLLESLKIRGSVRWECLLRCHNLKRLSLSTTSVLPQGWLEALLARPSALESLALFQMDNNIIDGLFRTLEENNNLNSLTVRFKSRDPNETISAAAVDQMRRTLLSNESLKSLSLSLKAGLLPVIVELLESDSCSLKHLRLDDVSPQDDSSLWAGLFENSTLRGLALCYRAHHQDHICEQTWNTILHFVRHNKQIESLELETPGGSNYVGAVDELAIALDKNTHLTDINLRHNPRNQPQFDFVCRLFGRRNRILMAQTGQMPIPKSLWPQVLQSMTPSSLFLIACHVPLPTSSGNKRKRSLTTADAARLD